MVDGPIWIDAVCIDQGDDRDKSVQIPLMSSIYSQAGAVLIWLWKLPEEAQMAVEMLKCVSNALVRMPDSPHLMSEETITAMLVQAEDYYQCLRRLELLFGLTEKHVRAFMNIFTIVEDTYRTEKAKSENETRKMLREKELSEEWHNTLQRIKDSNIRDVLPDDHIFWTLLVVLFSNEWFQRVWTFQEKMRASHSITLCPDGIISGHILDHCLDIMKLWGETCLYSEKSLLRASVYRELQRVENFRRNMQPNNPRLDEPGSFSRLLRISIRRKAALPKDHVYGILGMTDRATASRIPINYDESDAAIFAQAVGVAVEDWPSALPELWEDCTEAPPLPAGHPSWVPDLSNGSSFSRLDGQRDQDVISHLTKKQYISLASVAYLEELHAIRFAAIHLTSVTRCSIKAGPPHNDAQLIEFLGTIARPPSADEPWYGEWHMKWLQNNFSNSFSRERSEWLAGLCATFPGTCDSKPDLTEEVKAILCRATSDRVERIPMLLKYCYYLHLSQDNTQLLQPSRSKEHDEHEGLTPLDKKTILLLQVDLLAILSEISEKYIFQTSCGKTGICYRPLSHGDQILFVPGGNMLHAVSANRGRYLGAAMIEKWGADALLYSPSIEKGQLEMFEVS
jgi:hypothetical protein